MTKLLKKQKSPRNTRGKTWKLVLVVLVYCSVHNLYAIGYDLFCVFRLLYASYFHLYCRLCTVWWYCYGHCLFYRSCSASNVAMQRKFNNETFAWNLFIAVYYMSEQLGYFPTCSKNKRKYQRNSINHWVPAALFPELIRIRKLYWLYKLWASCQKQNVFF